MNIPPQNSEAEMCVLASMLLDPEACAIAIGMLKSADFYLPTHRHLFETISDLHGENIPVDIVILREELEKRGVLDKIGGTEYITTVLESVPTSSNVKHYAIIVQRHSLRRGLIELCVETERAARDEKTEVTATALAMRRALDNFEPPGEEGFTTIKAGMEQAIEEFHRLEQLRAEGKRLAEVTTGIKRLDEMIHLAPGTLTAIAGRPSHGKTCFAINILLYNARNGVPGAVFSLEMQEARLAINAICSLAGVETLKARNANLNSKDWDAFHRVYKELQGLPGVWRAPRRGMTNDQLAAWCRQAVYQYGAKFLILDYVQLVKSEGRSKVEEISNTSLVLKGLATELMIPVIVLVQLNRDCEYRAIDDRRPKLSDMKGAGQLEQDMDIALGMYRKYMYTKHEADKDKLEICIIKNREGAVSDIHVFTALERYQITEAYVPRIGG